MPDDQSNKRSGRCTSCGSIISISSMCSSCLDLQSNSSQKIENKKSGSCKIRSSSNPPNHSSQEIIREIDSICNTVDRKGYKKMCNVKKDLDYVQNRKNFRSAEDNSISTDVIKKSAGDTPDLCMRNDENINVNNESLDDIMSNASKGFGSDAVSNYKNKSEQSQNVLERSDPRKQENIRNVSVNTVSSQIGSELQTQDSKMLSNYRINSLNSSKKDKNSTKNNRTTVSNNTVEDSVNFGDASNSSNGKTLKTSNKDKKLSHNNLYYQGKVITSETDTQTEQSNNKHVDKNSKLSENEDLSNMINNSDQSFYSINETQQLKSSNFSRIKNSRSNSKHELTSDNNSIKNDKKYESSKELHKQRDRNATNGNKNIKTSTYDLSKKCTNHNKSEPIVPRNRMPQNRMISSVNDDLRNMNVSKVKNTNENANITKNEDQNTYIHEDSSYNNINNHSINKKINARTKDSSLNTTRLTSSNKSNDEHEMKKEYVGEDFLSDDQTKIDNKSSDSNSMGDFYVDQDTETVIEHCDEVPEEQNFFIDEDEIELPEIKKERVVEENYFDSNDSFDHESHKKYINSRISSRSDSETESTDLENKHLDSNNNINPQEINLTQDSKEVAIPIKSHVDNVIDDRKNDFEVAEMPLPNTNAQKKTPKNLSKKDESLKNGQSETNEISFETNRERSKRYSPNKNVGLIGDKLLKSNDSSSEFFISPKAKKFFVPIYRDEDEQNYNLNDSYTEKDKNITNHSADEFYFCRIPKFQVSNFSAKSAFSPRSDNFVIDSNMTSGRTTQISDNVFLESIDIKQTPPHTPAGLMINDNFRHGKKFEIVDDNENDKNNEPSTESYNINRNKSINIASNDNCKVNHINIDEFNNKNIKKVDDICKDETININKIKEISIDNINKQKQNESCLIMKNTNDDKCNILGIHNDHFSSKKMKDKNINKDYMPETMAPQGQSSKNIHYQSEATLNGLIESSHKESGTQSCLLCAPIDLRLDSIEQICNQCREISKRISDRQCIDNNQYTEYNGSGAPSLSEVYEILNLGKINQLTGQVEENSNDDNEETHFPISLEIRRNDFYNKSIDETADSANAITEEVIISDSMDSTTGIKRGKVKKLINYFESLKNDE
ncbi:hypothetical protein COBT_001316 [Conglomerata obtusa]